MFFCRDSDKKSNFRILVITIKTVKKAEKTFLLFLRMESFFRWIRVIESFLPDSLFTVRPLGSKKMKKCRKYWKVFVSKILKRTCKGCFFFFENGKLPFARYFEVYYHSLRFESDRDPRSSYSIETNQSNYRYVKALTDLLFYIFTFQTNSNTAFTDYKSKELLAYKFFLEDATVHPYSNFIKLHF